MCKIFFHPPPTPRTNFFILPWINFSAFLSLHQDEDDDGQDLTALPKDIIPRSLFQGMTFASYLS